MAVSRSLLLLLALVVLEASVALLFTHIANATNTRGLAYVVLAIWLALSIGAGFAYRHRIPALMLVYILPGACVTAFVMYDLIGFYGFGWTGLMK